MLRNIALVGWSFGNVLGTGKAGSFLDRAEERVQRRAVQRGDQGENFPSPWSSRTRTANSLPTSEEEHLRSTSALELGLATRVAEDTSDVVIVGGSHAASTASSRGSRSFGAPKRTPRGGGRSDVLAKRKPAEDLAKRKPDCRKRQDCETMSGKKCHPIHVGGDTCWKPNKSRISFVEPGVSRHT